MCLECLTLDIDCFVCDIDCLICAYDCLTYGVHYLICGLDCPIRGLDCLRSAAAHEGVLPTEMIGHATPASNDCLIICLDCLTLDIDSLERYLDCLICGLDCLVCGVAREAIGCGARRRAAHRDDWAHDACVQDLVVTVLCVP